MDNYRAVQYLESLLGKTLRIHTADTRLFVGVFKCTDNVSPTTIYSLSRTSRIAYIDYRQSTSCWPECYYQDRNIILATTHEYRHPTPAVVSKESSMHPPGEATPLKLFMTSRFIGLVVVPGQSITKIELDEPNERSAIRESGWNDGLASNIYSHSIGTRSVCVPLPITWTH